MIKRFLYWLNPKEAPVKSEPVAKEERTLRITTSQTFIGGMWYNQVYDEHDSMIYSKAYLEKVGAKMARRRDLKRAVRRLRDERNHNSKTFRVKI